GPTVKRPRAWSKRGRRLVGRLWADAPAPAWNCGLENASRPPPGSPSCIVCSAFAQPFHVESRLRTFGHDSGEFRQDGLHLALDNEWRVDDDETRSVEAGLGGRRPDFERQIEDPGDSAGAQPVAEPADRFAILDRVPQHIDAAGPAAPRPLQPVDAA